jgi:predicted transglutaminase-like protease
MKQYIYFFKLNKSDQVLVEGMLEAFVSNLSMVSEGFYVFDVDHMLDLKPLIQDMMSETLSDICAYTSIPLKEKDVLTHLHTMKTLLKDVKGLKIGLLTNTDVIQCVSKDDVRLKPFKTLHDRNNHDVFRMQSARFKSFKSFIHS